MRVATTEGRLLSELCALVMIAGGFFGVLDGYLCGGIYTSF
jgi:hypothetical protein